MYIYIYRERERYIDMLCVYCYMCVYMCICMYMYIEREREGGDSFFIHSFIYSAWLPKARSPPPPAGRLRVENQE